MKQSFIGSWLMSECEQNVMRKQKGFNTSPCETEDSRTASQCNISLMYVHVLVVSVSLRSANQTFWVFLFSLRSLYVNTVLFDMWLIYSQLKLVNILTQHLLVYASLETLKLVVWLAAKYLISSSQSLNIGQSQLWAGGHSLGQQSTCNKNYVKWPENVQKCLFDKDIC